MKKPLPPLNAEDLWALDRIGQIAVSPDGQQVCCSVTRGSLAENKSTACLWLLPTGEGSPRQLTYCGDKDGQPAWSPGGESIAFLARREQQGQKDATPQLYLISPDGGEAQRKTSFAPGIESFKWLADGRRIVFTAWVWPELKGAAAQGRRHKAEADRKQTGYATSEAYYRYFDHNIPMGRALHLLLLDLATGKITDLFEGQNLELPRDAEGNLVYDPSPNSGSIAFVHDRAASPLMGNRLSLSLIDIASRRVTHLVDSDDWDLGAPRWRPDGLALAATAAQVGKRHTALNQLALVELNGSWQALGESRDQHVEAPLRWAADASAVYFNAQSRGRCHLWRHDLAAGSLSMAAEGGWMQGFGLGDGLIVYASDSAAHPVQLHVIRSGQAPQRLDHFNDALLAQRDLGELREVSLTGALGDAVQMWLTLPAGFNPRKKYPLLQVIHGGPFAAAGDSFSYRWNPHVLASRGHVVAQVNYHGSSGFGFAFRDSIMGRQGELELQDIEAGSDWLLAQRWADPRKLSATGGSYGGFLVAWMNGHLPTPGRYRSYVCHAGVFDRVATFSADSYPERPKDLGALYWQDSAKVLGQSPASAAAQMNTPTLVIHGAQDFRVPDCNGLAYYNTLKARGIEARLLWFPDENHWVLKPRNSQLWYREFLDWVEAHQARPRGQRGNNH